MNNWASDYSYVCGCVRVCMCVCRLGCLLSSDPSQSDSNSKDFWFNMQALTTYLRKASDQNPSASYYNVDILKYQVSVILQPNPDEYAVVKECSPKTRFTLSFSHSRQKENLTVVLAHSPQIMHMSHSPEVKSFLKQTQAITSKWIIHIFMLVQIWGQKSCQSQKQPVLTWIILKTYFVVFFVAFTKGATASQVFFFLFYSTFFAVHAYLWKSFL